METRNSRQGNLMNKILILLWAQLFLSTFSLEVLANGAIAQDAKNNSYTISWNYQKNEYAQNAATRDCKPDCKVVAFYKNSCAAVATNTAGAAGWAFGQSSLNESKTQALNNCKSYAGDSGACSITNYGCDGNKYYFIEAEQKEKAKIRNAERDQARKEELKRATTCLGYKAAKFSCASAGSIDACMSIRFGEDYLSYEYTCR